MWRQSGSSPRGRGTVPDLTDPISPGRFIPAGAGNRVTASIIGSTWSVHPRGGGEQGFQTIARRQTCGSSPRGRGTDHPSKGDTTMNRFIPAGAGNRRIRSVSSIHRTVHPRGGGEQIGMRREGAIGDGSSPRGRGTGRRVRAIRQFDRFIPAGAGNRLSQPGPTF